MLEFFSLFNKHKLCSTFIQFTHSASNAYPINQVDDTRNWKTVSSETGRPRYIIGVPSGKASVKRLAHVVSGWICIVVVDDTYSTTTL